jgi:hypothetical protein
VSTELSQQAAAFEEAIKALDEQTRRWATVGNFVIPDSSFFIQHPQKLEEVDFTTRPLDSQELASTYWYPSSWWTSSTSQGHRQHRARAVAR